MSAQPSFAWKNTRILVADDEPDMREIFAAWFRTVGCFVQEVGDGLAALEALAQRQFDVIVTDVRMPRLDGIHLVRRLHDSGSYTPVVIFVSGFVDLSLPDAFDLGVEAILSKPCDRKVLLNAVQRSLLRRDLVFAPPDSVQPPPPDKYLRETSTQPLDDLHVALGRGGLSLDVARPIIQDEVVGFSVSIENGGCFLLEGWGLLRWCDTVVGANRAGIEFLYLEDASRVHFARWLAEHAPVSFIPKACRAHSANSS